ncbi:hypothetical protein [Streptomyces sp. NPDC004726]
MTHNPLPADPEAARKPGDSSAGPSTGPLTGPSAVPSAGPSAGSLPIGRATRVRSVLRAVTIASCVPYLALKTAWIAGSRIGVPDDSVLLENRAGFIVLNTVTALMDAAVVVLALLLTRPWGRRVRAWFLTFPVWTASGLLAPIMAGFPFQLIAPLFDGAERAAPPEEPYLHDWVFLVVYCGFIVQGLALGALFVLYARERWEPLWRARTGDGVLSTTARLPRLALGAGALLAVFPAVAHLLWMSGSAFGWTSGEVASRTAEFHLLEGVRAVLVAVAVAGAAALLLRRAHRLPVRLPLAGVWVGSGAMATWGGLLTLSSLGAEARAKEGVTGVYTLTYAVEMVAGILLIAGIAGLLRRHGR